MTSTSCIRRFWTAAFLLTAVTSAWSQQYTSFKDIYNFGPSVPAGMFPEAPVSFDKAGNMYGTTYGGGSGKNLSNQPCGIVWELTTDGKLLDLHDFPASTFDGQNPSTGVTIDAAGNLYGATSVGGAHGDAANTDGCGMIWEIKTDGTYVDVHDFGASTDGRTPTGPMSFDAAGNLYGAAQDSGANSNGMVWEITKSGKYIDLHDFGSTSTDGKFPSGGVTLDGTGNLYGTTGIGGANGFGMVWEITISGKTIDLHDFGSTSDDGKYPEAGVSLDSVGNLYGTAESGGANGVGMVWEQTTGGKYIDLHDFGSYATDGRLPGTALSFDAVGNLYGTTSTGGANGYANGAHGDGMVWEISAIGKFIDVHDFGSSTTDGIYPLAGVSFDKAGNLYGTTYGGANTSSGNPTGFGMVFELVLQVPVPIKSISVSPTSVQGGTSATGTVSLTGYAPSGGQSVPLSSNSPEAALPASVTVPSGAASAIFTVSTTGVDSQVVATITAGTGSATKSVTLNITPATLTSISLSPISVSGGVNSTGTVTLGGPAGIGGTSVALTSSSASAVVPPSAIVPAAATSATFTITTKGVSSQTAATITGTLHGASKAAALAIAPAALALMSVSPSSVTGGTNSTGTVSLSGDAAAGGLTVSLSSTSPYAKTPSSVKIPAGSSSATFTITTKAAATQETVTLTAKSGSVKKTATLTIAPPLLASMSLNPTSVTGGGNSTGTVTLTGPAPASGFVAKLSSSSKSAKVPASVIVPGGKQVGSFTIKTSAVAVQTAAKISASQGTNTATTTLSVNPPTLSSLKLTPAQVSPGGTSTAKITITGLGPTGGIAVSISCSTSGVTFPTSVKIPAGASVATFAVKLAKTAPSGAVTITAALGSSSQAAKLTIK